MPDDAAHHDDPSAEEQELSSAPVAEARAPAAPGFLRKDVLAAAVLCLVTFALWLPRLGGPIDLRTDAAVYYITGVALAEGKGYSLLNEPGEVAAVQYPPGLPVFVAVHRWLVGSADPQVLGVALRRSYLLISLAYVVAVYAVARRLLGPAGALAAGLITSLFLQTYFLSNSLFSEIPFALVAMLFLLTAPRSNRPGWFALSSVLAAAAFLIRTAGIALLAAWVGEALLRRQWKQLLARTVVAAIPFFGWQIYVSSVTGTAQYQQPAYEYQRAAYVYHNVPYSDNVALIDPFQPEHGHITTGEVVTRLAGNLIRMPLAIGHSVSTVPGYYEWTLRDAHNWLRLPRLPIWMAAVPPTVLGLMVIAGLGVLAWRGEWLIVLFAGATVCLVALTPWPVQFTRYLTPLTPLLAISLVVFLTSMRRRHAPGPETIAAEGSEAASGACRAGGAPFLVVVVFIVGMQLYSLTRAYRSGWTLVPAEVTRLGGGRLYFFDEKWMGYAEAVQWLRQRVEEGDVVTTSAPQWTYLASGMKAVMPAMEINRSEAQRLLDTVPVRYAIIDRADPGEVVARYLEPMIEAHPDKWRLVFQCAGGTARVYERVR